MRKQKVLACLLGGAIGDALGAPLEFLSLQEIRKQYGPEGLTDFAQVKHDRGCVTDDTQMMLFTLEGLIRAQLRWMDRGMCHPPTVVYHAYLRWLLTQRRQPTYDLPEYVSSGWLIEQKALHHVRAPGNSCLSALQKHEGPADKDHPVNDSKGCGGVMRIAPVGLFANDPFTLGIEIAALTHGHPSGYLSAGFFARLIQLLALESPLDSALARTLEELATQRDSEECLRAVRGAISMANSNPGSSEALESLGSGWVAEEAIAIAVYCALSATSFEEGVCFAINHSGDSDSTGLLVGHLLGLKFGLESIPEIWISVLDVKHLLFDMVDDAELVFSESELSEERSRLLMEKYPPN